jgi:hypothetical protein
VCTESIVIPLDGCHCRPASAVPPTWQQRSGSLITLGAVELMQSVPLRLAIWFAGLPGAVAIILRFFV